MAKTTYSNCIGRFSVENGKLTEEKLYSHKEILENYKALEEKPEMPTAEMLAILSQKKYLEKFREANILITKKKVSESLKGDQLIIQAVHNIEEIDKVANLLARRLREWYELYNPEFSKSVESHEKFAELIATKSKKDLLKEVNVTVEESMGAEISPKDLEPIMELARELSKLYGLRKKQEDYVEKAMKEQMPNINAITGPLIGAKMLSIAGSLEKMVLFPSSTIQLLGAEKALFRHIKTGAKSPKYGVIINHPLVTKAKPSEKGRAARLLGDKISIAAKIDYFKGEFRGEELLADIKKKLGQ